MVQIRELLNRLHDAGVEFVIVGGVAAWCNGSTLGTKDFDVCCRMSEENMRRLLSAIGDLNPVVRGDPRKLPLPRDPVYLATFKVIILVTDLGNFDVLAALDAVGDFDAVARCSTEMEVAGRPTMVLGIDALIANEKAAGRDKDKLGIMHLEAAKRRRESMRGTSQQDSSPD
jgi:hypothetical protein